MGVLPIAFDGMYGVVAWCPSKPADTLYIVISKAVITDVVNAEVNAGEHDVAKFLDKHLKRHPDFSAPSADKKGLFMDIMCRTPLKVTSKNRKSDHKWMKENLERYMIVEGHYWNGLFNKINEVCPNRSTELSDDTKCKFILERRMVQRFSVPVNIKEANEYDGDATVTYKNMENKVLGCDELSVMPAMNFMWWDEAYSGGCQEFFNMEPVEGLYGHVQSGKYVEPDGNVYARGYEETVARIIENFQSENKKDERATSRGKRRRTSNC